MNNDQHKDSRVSAAYNDLATERTPDQLDRIVLDMAAANTKRPSYSRWMSWSRPIAWAATVTLCLAITLELAREPGLDVDSPASPPVQAGPQLLPPAQAPVESRESTPYPLQGEAEEARKRKQEQRSTEVSSPEVTEAPARLDENKAAKRQSNAPAPAALAIPAAEGVAEKDLDSRSMRDEASDLEVADSSECAADAREEPQSWLECVQALELAGNKIAAQNQRELLMEAFPDFKLP